MFQTIKKLTILFFLLFFKTLVKTLHHHPHFFLLWPVGLLIRFTTTFLATTFLNFLVSWRLSRLQCSHHSSKVLLVSLHSSPSLQGQAHSGKLAAMRLPALCISFPLWPPHALPWRIFFFFFLFFC